MKKRINKDLTLYFTSFYPFNKISKSKKIYTVTLGIGGNIGNIKQRFHKLFLALKSNCKFDIIRTSPLLKNPPFGYLEQDYFINGLIVIQTNLAPIILLNEMQRYENRFGRKRSFKDAPRTLDIDIIFIKKGFKDISLKHKRLIVPHIGWKERDSVKIPIKYINNIL
ncbi:MAG: 2-amino-4-hydroxy-6-hydroxymethyldihydropteridine diphosphokinase [Arcobacteraceae bacterium]|nr:2-amino-4-hydroxy-6-hydroxymethyldihydropteridine diphosphokinase [Arcobacteraceae bacterium]